MALGLAASYYVVPGNIIWPLPAMAAQTPGTVEAMWFEEGRLRPETRSLLSLLRRAGEHGLDPADYRVEAIARGLASATGAERRQAGAMLSGAVAAYARDLRVPRSLDEVTYIDPELIPSAPDLEQLAAEGSLEAGLSALQADNSLYEELREGLRQYRLDFSSLPQIRIGEGPALAPGSRGPRVAALRQRLGLPSELTEADRFDTALGNAVRDFRAVHGLAPSPVADRQTIAALDRGAAHYEALIVADLDRLRALPLGKARYVLVDRAAARLKLIEGGRVVDTMRVIVGKPGMETPLLAGFIRFAMVNPYWNVPPDLVRTKIAPAVLQDGVGLLKRHAYVLSPDWRTTARVDPRKVDWRAVAAGRADIWVRQLPGGGNMMGEVKFMLPNDMGIYLHDTPDKALFQRENRQLSSGCVRVEDAARLARWLFGREILDGDPAPDRRVDLPAPVPVFVTHLATAFEDGRIRFRPEVDPAPRGSTGRPAAAATPS